MTKISLSGPFSLDEEVISFSQISSFKSRKSFLSFHLPSTGEICPFAEQMCDAVGTGRTIPSVPRWPCQGTETLGVYTVKSINLNKSFNVALSFENMFLAEKV